MIGLRIAAAIIVTAVVAIAIVTLGVMAVGSDTFTRLMMESGASAEEAHEMFDHSLTLIVAVAVVTAATVAVGLAVLMARRLTAPLSSIGAAARRLAAGDYRTRVPRSGPDEIATLADSFNQLAASLEEQERIRRDFIANASHELRTPLTNLQGYLEAMRDGVLPADPQAVESLLEEAQRLARLARSLDTLAAGDSGAIALEVVELDASAAIRAAVQLVAPGLDRASIRLTTKVPDGLRNRADPDSLAQILGNLLQNAQRYTPRGGAVTVEAERRGDRVLITISNTGDGIPPADLPHVFERFYRVDKSRTSAAGGAGIGLAIVERLVQALGGTVGASSVGGLTRFWFELPAAD